ncbi:polysaccharide deacetylase family protein [Gaiella sp.]|uniref:polysaccharide deacetylase family protein n=1 Tax=Gaiella sp. TaxID=2663207 RepID=UPI003265D863
MAAYAAKQHVKNTVYLGVGTVGRLRRPVTGGLRVLLYHKVNDAEGNPGSVPTALFAEHMALIDAEGYRPVALDNVLDHLYRGASLPPRATLITFDDGYRDNLVGAAPILARSGYPAVLFVSVGSIGSDVPFPHDEGLPTRNPTLDWEGLAEIERLGVRVESHGITHVPLARLASSTAERELVTSKRVLEEHLGRPIRAYAYVKGGVADFQQQHRAMLRRSGYEAAFTTVTGLNKSGADPFALRRYNVEPYPASTLSLVLRGACDAMALKDSGPGTAARRAFNRVLRTTSK